MSGGNASASPPARSRDGRIFGALVALLALAWLARLVPQALAARLMTDECFHAYVSRWIAQHHALPLRIDGLYGGFAYFYPPLYHLVGALAFTLAGLRGFELANLGLLAALLLVMARGAGRLGGPAAARWAVGLAVATPFLALHGVRMYVEMLSTLLVTAAALQLAALLRAPRARDGVLLGVAAGLAILAKLSALPLPPLLAALAFAYALRGRRDVAGPLALAAGVALLVAAPLFVRNALLFGSPLYPVLGRDVNPLVLQLNVRHFTPPASALWAETLRRAAAPVGALLAAALAAAWRRRGGVELAIAGALVLLALLAPLQPLVEARHLLPLVVATAVLAAIALARALAERAALRRAVDVAVLAAAAWGVLALPALRTVEELDEPRGLLAAFDAVRAHVPAGETVLARETYDVFWHAGRPANWPVPFGQRDVPIRMFITRSPDSSRADLRAHGLRWVLLTDEPVQGAFNGGDWPASFWSAIDTLEAHGAARTVWESDDARLVRMSD